MIKTVHVGAEGYPDYTVAPHDTYRRTRYIERHQSSKDWTAYMSSGALSRCNVWKYTKAKKT